ncbi:MAG: hypothetical protein WBG38_17035 [Nodosilinea sp.]
MVHFLASLTRRQCFAIPFALAVGAVSPAALFAPQAIANEFEGCTSTLIEAGIEAASAAGACGKTLRPADLSSCTLDITLTADVSGEQALGACQGDRRPQDLATCVSDIHQVLEVANSTAVLNSCRRSVLPMRFADCVVGVAAAADLAVTNALFQCSTASYLPEDVAPTFVFSR